MNLVLDRYGHAYHFHFFKFLFRSSNYKNLYSRVFLRILESKSWGVELSADADLTLRFVCISRYRDIYKLRLKKK